MTLVLLALLSQTPPANCVGNACTVGQRGNDVTLGGQVKVTVGPLGDGGTAYIKPAIQGVPLVIQSEQPTGTSSAAAVTIQATNKHDGGTILSVKNGLVEVFAVGPGGATSPVTPSSVITPFVDAGSVRSVSFEATAAAASDGFNCLTEGCRTRFGPDTYAFETGTSLRFSGATGTIIVDGALSTSAGNLVSGGDLLAGATAASGSDLQLSRHIFSSANGAYQILDSETAPTVVACSGTAASITWANGTRAFKFDVGTSCAGESTAVLTLAPAAANGYVCQCASNTADRTINCLVTSTTVTTCTNVVISSGAAGDFTDGADLECICRGG